MIFRRIADTISWILSALSAVDCILLIFELRNNIIVPFGTIVFTHTTSLLLNTKVFISYVRQARARSFGTCIGLTHTVP